MTTVSATLGVARSNVVEHRDSKRRRRGPQERTGDVELASAIRRFVDKRPTYGYRRIAALLKRERRSDGLAPVNAKRVYRLMKKHGLFVGLGAYFVLILNIHNISMFTALPIAAIGCGVAALPMWLVSRLRSGYFAIATWVLPRRPFC